MFFFQMKRKIQLCFTKLNIILIISGQEHCTLHIIKVNNILYSMTKEIKKLLYFKQSDSVRSLNVLTICFAISKDAGTLLSGN